MSGARFVTVLATEIRLLLRERLTWAVLAALLVALCVGARTGAERVTAERAAVARAAQAEARAVGEAKAAYARYARPSPVKVNYWQDPTHAFGYMTQFLTVHAVKPATPLAALATGQSDVQPSLMRVGFGFSTVFDDTAYELGSAARLRLGAFDLTFVLVYLVPLAVIALAGTRLAAEQDTGILRLLASQPIAPRLATGAKFGAVALVATTGTLAAAALALALFGGLPPLTGWGTTLALLAAALAAYTLLWVAACAVVVSLWRGAVTALVLLVLAWACAAVAVPAALGLAVEALAPRPSRIAAIDASRQVQERFYSGTEGSRLSADWLASHVPGTGRPGLLDAPEIKRLARDAFYDAALAPHRYAARAHSTAAADWSGRLALLSPASAFALALETAAGSDAGRHAAFLAAAADYRATLRAFFEPRILAQALHPAPVCDGCQARLDFDAYDSVPVFPVSLDPGTAERQALLSLASLLAGSLLLGLIAFRRLARWPV
ncbi:DUF3526 domain-containing protein [Methylobacterium aquaticum]|uniref:DUF3526 domain-containing protein n=1 Tax=Methylobacterium aquaticum TaxID=270351 RepID=UPI003D165D88